jgi:predicted nucleic acid-binding protein
MKLVIDTNIVLDLWGFGDPRVHSLALLLCDDARSDAPQWIATPEMRAELHTVLARAHLQTAFAQRGRSHAQVAQAFDVCAKMVQAPNPLSMAMRVHCTDADDQKFINLALAHGAVLLSKDKAVLKCKKRLAQRGVLLASAWPIAPPS